MLQIIASIHYRRINNKLQYFQHWTFGSQIVDLLGWKPKDHIGVTTNQLCVTLFRPDYETNPYYRDNPKYSFYTLGVYKGRTSLWLNYQITAIQRQSFLRNQSNGIATKVCWRPGQASFAVDQSNHTVTVYGAGETFRNGVSRTK
jgi:hypothetical protein